MKKIIWLAGSLALLWGTAVPVSAAETTSDVGITFYQGTNRRKIVPMQKITVDEEPTTKQEPTKQEPTIQEPTIQEPTIQQVTEEESTAPSFFGLLPKTNQQTNLLLVVIGSLVLSIFSVLYYKKKARKSDHELTT